MGVLFSNLYQKLFGKDEFRIVIIGLDNAGKTSILTRLHSGYVPNTIPTIGFNVETIKFNDKTELVSWDIGGQAKIRPLWRHYFENTQGVIFVIDSCDEKRMESPSHDEREDSVEFELGKVARDDLLSKACFLIFANKQDMKGSLSAKDVAQKIQLNKTLKQHPWFIQGCSAVTGDGLFEGLEWLVKEIRSKNKK